MSLGMISVGSVPGNSADTFGAGLYESGTRRSRVIPCRRNAHVASRRFGLTESGSQRSRRPDQLLRPRALDAEVAQVTAQDDLPQALDLRRRVVLQLDRSAGLG